MWLQHVILFFLTVLVYLHIFIHFKVNPENEFITLDDVGKDNITSTTFYKLPFVFDGTSIMKPVDLKQCIKKDRKSEIYTKIYDSIPLLEPKYIFSTKDTIYDLKDKITTHYNLECLNYYLVHSGKVQVYCIHPKYKDHLQHNDHFLENENVLKAELHPNSILFVPNYWYVCIKQIEKERVDEEVEKETVDEKEEKEKVEKETVVEKVEEKEINKVEEKEKCIVEKIQYKTPLNHLNFYYDHLLHYLK